MSLEQIKHLLKQSNIPFSVTKTAANTIVKLVPLNKSLETYIETKPIPQEYYSFHYTFATKPSLTAALLLTKNTSDVRYSKNNTQLDIYLKHPEIKANYYSCFMYDDINNLYLYL